jgi:hypothetical protein
VSQSGPKVALKNSFDVLKSTTDDHANASTSRVGELTPQVVDSDEDEADMVYDETAPSMTQQTKVVDTKGTTKQEMGEAVKSPEHSAKLDEKTGNIGSGSSSLYSQFKQCDYSDDDDDEVYDLDENEISEIHRAFCKTMDTTLKGHHRK